MEMRNEKWSGASREQWGEDGRRPGLAGHARLQKDRVTGVTMLLYPEGALELSGSAEAVVRLCDGTRTLEDVFAALTESFEGVREEDVWGVVMGLVERGVMVS